MIFKKLLKPKSNDTHKIQNVQLWYVKWTARHGIYSYDTEQQMEAFTSKDDAIEFKNSLKAAFKLIKHTSGTKVSLTKN